MRDSDTEYIKRMGDRIAELERDRQMYVNSSDRLTAQVKELEATISEKDKCLYELEDEIIRLQPIIDAENKRIAELEAELAKMKEDVADRDFCKRERDSYLSQALNHGITIIKLKEDIAALTVHPALCDEYPKVCANNRIAELETALKEIQDHCAGKTGSLQAVVVVIVRKALEGK